jgi:hypothetical protein
VDPSKGLVFQYELQLQDGLDCGGAYLKLLSEDKDLDVNTVHGETPAFLTS